MREKGLLQTRAEIAVTWSLYNGFLLRWHKAVIPYESQEDCIEEHSNKTRPPNSHT